METWSPFDNAALGLFIHGAFIHGVFMQPLHATSSFAFHLGDFVYQPFEPELDWTRFSVTLPQSDIPRLHEILGDIDMDQYNKMQARSWGIHGASEHQRFGKGQC